MNWGIASIENKLFEFFSNVQLDSIKYVQELLQKDQTLSQFLQTYLLRVLIKINNSIGCHDVEERNVKMIASLVMIIEYIGPDVYLMSSQVLMS